MPTTATARRRGGSDTLRQADSASSLPPADAAADAAAEAWRACSFNRQLALFSLMMHGSVQLVCLLAWHRLGPSERWQRLGSIGYATLPVLAPMLAPAFYMRWRQYLVFAYRVGEAGRAVLPVALAMPASHPLLPPQGSFNSRCCASRVVRGRGRGRGRGRRRAAPVPRGSAPSPRLPLRRRPPPPWAVGIQQVLEDAPLPGPRGAAKDLLKLAWGEHACCRARARPAPDLLRMIRAQQHP